MKILVTGTAGFIGFHLANKLIAENYEVTGVDSINDYYDVALKYARLSFAGIEKEFISYNQKIQSNKHNNYFFYQLLLEDKEDLAQIFEKENFNIVIHLAAQAGVRYSLTNAEAYVNSNIVGFINVLECCRQNKIQHLIYASSSSVYGINDEIPFTLSQKTDHPISLYGASKKSNELLAHVYSYLFGLPTTGLRFFTVYGPWGRPDMAFFSFTKKILEGKCIELFNNGDMLRDFTFIDDIVEGLIKIIQHSSKNSSSNSLYKLYNIGNASPVTLMDFVYAIEKELNIKAKKKFLPMQPGDIKETYADVTELIKDFNYKPSTTIEEGIKKFVNWYKQYYKFNE